MRRIRITDILDEYIRSYPYTENAVKKFWDELDRRNKVNKAKKE